MAVAVAVLTPHLRLDAPLLGPILQGGHLVLHVDEAHVLRMRDDAVRKKRLDDRQPGQGDVVCPLVDVNDGAHGVDGVGQLGEVPEEPKKGSITPYYVRNYLSGYFSY